MATEFLVEFYLPGRDRAQVDALDARARIAAEELVAEGALIGYVRSISLPSDEACLWLFEADDPEVVAEAVRRAGIAPDRIVATGDTRMSTASPQPHTGPRPDLVNEDP